MILKVKQNDGTWKFVDAIDNAVVGKDGTKGEKLVDYERHGEMFSIDVTEGAFLMADSGKTIDRLS